MTLETLLSRKLISRQEFLIAAVFGFTDYGRELLSKMVDDTMIRALATVKSEGQQIDLNPQVLAYAEGRRSVVADICIIIDKVSELMQKELTHE